MARSPNQIYTDQTPSIVETWSGEGMTYKQMAQALGVDPRTFYYWLNKHDELVSAVVKGRYQYAAKIASRGSEAGLRMQGENIQTVTCIRGGKEYSYKRHIPAEVNASCLVMSRI